MRVDNRWYKGWIVLLLLATLLEISHSCQTREIMTRIEQNSEILRLHREEAQEFINADTRFKEAREEESKAFMRRLDSLETALNVTNKFVSDVRDRQRVNIQMIESIRSGQK